MFRARRTLSERQVPHRGNLAFGEVVGWDLHLRGYKAASRFGCRSVTALRATFGWLSPLRYGCRAHSKNFRIAILEVKTCRIMKFEPVNKQRSGVSCLTPPCS